MNKNKNKKTFAVYGSKKGGGGSTFREDENTLQTSQTVRSLFAIGEGPIGGLVDGARSIFINDTPLQNADGSFNFGGKIAWDDRVGTPSQPAMPGFPSASSEVLVGVEVTAAASATRSVGADADAARVTIGLPQGLYEHKTDSNELVGGTVELAIDKKLSSSGTWAQERRIPISGKTTSPYAESYRVERPVGSGGWDIRVRRITPDNASATLKNNTFWNSFTEIQDLRLEYENTAYVGVAIDAKDLGTSNIPTVGFEVYGLKVRVPSNYNPVTRAYSGVWDGTFKTEWTDNPAWHLYDLLTHPRYGLGQRITDVQVDKYSFYSAAVYNDQLVPDGKGGQQPRFTCNVPIQAREEALRVCQNLAGVMRAKIVWLGGRIALVQDRPTSSVRVLTKANVIDGEFSYASSTVSERFTAVHVTWNDPDANYMQRTSTVEAASDLISRYGYNATEEYAYGCTNEGQAIRFGKWYLDSVHNQTEFAKFKMSLNGFDLTVGDVVTIYDADYSGLQNAGRLLAGSTKTSIKLDRPVTLSPGSTIELRLPDGSFETRSITQTSGTLDTITVTSPFSAAPEEYADYGVTTTVSPRKFRITKITQSEKNVIEIEALLYDANKYNRIELGISVPAPVFSAVPDSVTSAPTDLTITERVYYVNNVLKRSLLVGWLRPSLGNPTGYKIQYRINGGAWVYGDCPINYYEVADVPGGLFECRVVAISHVGIKSPALEGEYGVVTTPTPGSDLLPVTGLAASETSTTTFQSVDLTIQFTNPTGNGTKPIALKDFEVKIIDPNTNNAIRAEYVGPVLPGETQTYTYSYASNRLDGGGTPRRTVRIEVRCRDANNRTSTATTATFTNPAPDIPSAISITPGIGSNKITYALPTDPDFKGVLVWRGTASNFTLSASTLVYDTTDNYIADNALTKGTTYYYRIAAYDQFAKSDSGSGLNVSAAISATPIGTGISSGPTNPAAGSTGDVFFNTTDGKLYRWVSGAWKKEVETTDLIGAITSSQISDTAITAAKLATGAVTAAKTAIAAINSATGDLNSNTVSSSSIVSSAVTSTKIADAAVTAAKTNIAAISASTGNLVANAVQSANIAANAVTAAKTAIAAIDPSSGNLTANSVTAVQIAAGTITADKIQAATITGDKIAANTIAADNMAAGSLTIGKFAPSDKWSLQKAMAWDGSDTSGWAIASGTGTLSVISDSNAVTGGKVMHVVGACAVEWKDNIPFDPTKLYKVTVRVRHTADPASGTKSFYAGFTGIAGDGVTRVNVTGLNSISSQHYVAIANLTLGVSTTFTEKIGYVKGTASSGSGSEKSDASAPGAMHQNVRYIRPLIYMNWSGGGEGDIDSVQIDVIDIPANAVTSTSIVDGSITTSKIQAAAITSDKIFAGAIGTDQLAVNSVVASKLVVSDLSNSYPDYDMLDDGFYSSSTGASYLFGGTGVQDRGQHYMQINVSASQQSVESGWAQCECSADYYAEVSADVGSAATGSGTATVEVEFGTLSAAGVITPTRRVQVLSRTNSTATTRAGFSITTTSSERRFRFVFSRAAGGTAVVHFGGPMLRRKANGNLIVDGSVTASKIAANAITAAQIAANTITAAQIQAGTIGANELAAKSITAKQLAITDFENLVANPSGQVDAGGWYPTYGSFSATSESGIPCLEGTNMSRDTYVGEYIPVQPGDQFYLSFEGKWMSGDTAVTTLGLRFMTTTAGTTNNWQGACNVAADGVWHSASGSISAPAGYYFAQVWIQHNVTAGVLSTWRFRNVRVQRKNSGSLIVDGAITTAKLAANAVTANEIAADAVTAGKILAAAVTSDKIAANAITADKIAANTITADKIAAGTITSNEIATATVNAIRADINKVIVDSAGYAKSSGVTNYSTGTGFFLGYESSAYKFRVGVPNGNGIFWDGTNLTIKGGGTFSGALSAATGSFAGSLSSATGTFSGSLSAATGTFAGSLSAATGTFSGSLTATAVNAVNTINLAGNAVTIPVSVYTDASTSSIWTGGAIIQQASIQSSGSPIAVFASARLEIHSNNNYTYTVQIIRDGTVVYQMSAPATYYGITYTFTVAITDTPGVGAHTYYVKLYGAGDDAAYASQRSLILLETKR